MKLSKYNTRRPVSFNPLFDDMFARDLFYGVPAASCSATTNNFATNISESPTAFTLELSAPGFSKEQFNIELNESAMTVSAQKDTPDSKEKSDEKATVKYTRREFGSQSLKRSFSLPKNIDKESVGARYNNGVLFVTLPKLKETVAPKRHIEVG